MDINTILHALTGPVIGGIIGYFTNFIAIKMLFRPYKEIKIGKYTLPFTPGIIPRRKDKLAHAIGEAVAEKMFTEEDIQKIFLSENMKNTVTDSILDILYYKDDTRSLVDLLNGVMPEEEASDFQNLSYQLLCRKVHLFINKTDIAQQISNECTKVLSEKFHGALTSNHFTSSRIESVSDYMGTQVQQYMKQNADTLIMPFIQDELIHVFVQPLGSLFQEFGTDQEKLRNMIRNIYEKFMSEYSMTVTKIFDIAALTERKIIEFQTKEIEALVNQTIQKEMQAVVNLGALLGIIIGLVNIFI